MLYRIVIFILWIFLRIIYLPVYKGAKNIPKKGPVILCANHISFIDPLIIAIKTRRVVHYMGKKELFANPVISRFLLALNAFPVDREKADIGSYKKALTILRKEQVLGIFAQGTRVKDNEGAAAKSGAAMFALKSGAVVVPVGISGKYKLFSRVRVTFGEPISFGEAIKKPKREHIDEAMNKIETAMGMTLNEN